MDKWELEKEREKAFEKWFDKWYKESEKFKDIEDKIRARNLEKLKEKFPELTVMARDSIGSFDKIIIINWY